MIVEIVNTGSELMLGRVLNTHQQWLCRRLADLGHVVARQIAVADTANEIQAAVRESLSRADLVITTGGLGPTSDDLTRELVAELLGKKLIHHPEILAHIENRFARMNRPRPARTSVECLVPEGALFFLNANGTAPGLAMKIEAKSQKPSSQFQWLVMLPGPPRELRPMFDEFIVPLIHREFPSQTFVCRTLRSTGIGESRVEEAVAPALQPLVGRGLQIGYCARPGAVDVRLCAGGADAAGLVAESETVVKKIMGKNIFGADDEEIESVIVKILAEKRQTLALAESCTGGNIANRITNVSGASEVFPGGVVCYANSAKENFLGVSPETLQQHGAVSEAVAREMAAGAREKFQADFALAVTGIAGPGGATPDKPVGTVFIALASAAGTQARQMLNPWDRYTFKDVTSTQALELLRVHLISA
jgi:nicotinamide-nucleotide amidase